MTKRVSEILYEMAAEEGFYFLDIVLPKRNLDKNRKANKVYNLRGRTPYGKNKKNIQFRRKTENGNGSYS